MIILRTPKETRDDFFQICNTAIENWASKPDISELGRCHGLYMDILRIIDGKLGIPRLDLIVNENAEVLKFKQKLSDKGNGVYFYEQGICINKEPFHVA
jgi:hypothetical protein